MNVDRFPYSYPLSDADLVEIRARAQRERAIAISSLMHRIATAVRTVVHQVLRSHPANKPDTSADPYVNAAR